MKLPKKSPKKSLSLCMFFATSEKWVRFPNSQLSCWINLNDVCVSFRGVSRTETEIAIQTSTISCCGAGDWTKDRDRDPVPDPLLPPTQQRGIFHNSVSQSGDHVDSWNVSELTKPGLLVPLHFDGQAKVCQLHRRTPLALLARSRFSGCRSTHTHTHTHQEYTTLTTL